MQWDLASFKVTPAASVLSKCVSRGALSQEEIDFASSKQSHSFTPNIQEAHQRIKMKRQLDELQLELELLKVEQKSADVTHIFHLAKRYQMLQVFCSHLQDILKEQKALRLRLMRPLGCTNLPIHAHLHKSVVEVVKMLLDSIETLEEKLRSVQNSPFADKCLTQLNTSLAQLLSQVAMVESFSNQVLQWKEVRSSVLGDSSNQITTME